MDEGRYSCEEVPVPVHLNTFALPNDAPLRLEYEIYRSSKETKALKSELDRTIYAEEFIENPNLGTLKDLCVRAIARTHSAKPFTVVQKNPKQLEKHYESLDINLPLKKAYNIDSDVYWRRVVLAKTNDPTLILRKHYEWKNEGISKKFVEVLEDCPAEYWPQEEMIELALMVKDFIKVLHIRRLKSLGNHAFVKYFQFDRSSSSRDEEENLESPIETPIETSEEDEHVRFDEIIIERTTSEMELEALKALEKAQRKEQRRQLRESREKERELRHRRRERRERKRLERLALEEAKAAQTKKKKKMKQPISFFNIPLSESEDDGVDKVCDRRNRELLLASTKMYTYPSSDCHHIDLSIVQYLTNLDTLWIEFLGPVLQRDYHYRHLNFSYNDMKNLAIGVKNLPVLRVFRLRNSRMDSMKLDILIDTLKDIPSLKVLDFGFDSLEDDCVIQWKKLFSSTKSVCNLELESNLFNVQTMQALGDALRNYANGTLEYLGLARNPITDSALHALVSNIVDTKQIKCINVSGMTNLTEQGISCCIANELIRRHSPLIYLDMTGVYTSSRACDEIVKALDVNKKILGLKVHGCSLDEETEFDITILINRNKYINENPFVGDITVPNEDIDAWIYRTKNPVMLDILKERQYQAECMENLLKLGTSECESTENTSCHKILPEGRRLSIISTSSHASEATDKSARKHERFVYESIDFTEKEFLKHIYVEGHGDRYRYMKSKRPPVSSRQT